VPEVQFRRGLGHSIRPAMALDGRFTSSSFVRKLLQTKAHAASKPSPLEGISRLSPKPRARLRTFRYYYHWKIGTKFFGVADEDRFRCLRHWSVTITFTPAGMGRKRSSASSAELARATESLAEHAFAYTLLDCIIVDEEHVRHDTTLPLRAHDKREHAIRLMFVSLTPTAGAGRGSAHELRARPATSVHFPGRIPVRAAPRVRKRADGFLLPG
jgi:hypothetical protein